MTAELLLIDAKYGHNLGAAVRAAATLGANRVSWTGDRVAADLVSTRGRERLPREERLRQYDHVEWGQVDQYHCFDEAVARGLTPVAVEVKTTWEQLPDFEHPADALYVFGPEDGGLRGQHLMHCHRFVTIPSAGCVNLAAAAYIVLYDRAVKDRSYTTWRCQT